MLEDDCDPAEQTTGEPEQQQSNGSLISNTVINGGGEPQKSEEKSRDPWQFIALSDMKANERFPKWHSLLTMEDYMVAALMKRLMYEGEAITNVAAYHGLRDALGQLIFRVNKINPDLAGKIDKILETSDGSGGDDRAAQPPPPNP
jgi:hypothetical protein